MKSLWPAATCFRTGCTFALLALFACVGPSWAQLGALDSGDAGATAEDSAYTFASRGGPPPEEAAQVHQDAVALMDAEAWEQAIPKLLEATQEYSGFAQAFFDLGRCYVELEEYDPAAAALSRARQIAAQNYPEIYYQLGDVFLELGEYRQAVDNLSQAVEYEPSNAQYVAKHGEAMVDLALQSRDLQLLDSAVDSLDRAIELQDDMAEAYSDRGRARIELAEWDDALADLDRSIELAPTDRELLQRVGFAYLRHAAQQETQDPTQTDKIVASYENAEAAMTRFLDETPPDAEEDPKLSTPETVLVARAVTRIERADFAPEGGGRIALYQAAIDDCLQALELEDQMPSAHYNCGVAYRMLGQYRDAIESFTEALKLSPEYAEANLRRGIVWFYADEFELALADFESASLGGSDPRAAFWTGLVLSKQGKYDEAIEAFGDVLRLNPGHVMAYTNRGLARLQTRDFDRAVEDFNNVILRDQTDAVSYYRRGVAYELGGDRDAATRSYRKALKWDPALASAQRRLSQLGQ